MSVFIKHSLYVSYSYSQYKTEVLQSLFKLLMSPSGPSHVVLQYHMTILGRDIFL